MAMLYRPLASYRETWVFPPVGLEKPLGIFKPFLAYVITSARSTNPQNLVEIGSQGAPPHIGEIYRFCDLCSPFFPFLHLAHRSQFWSDPHACWLKRRVWCSTRAFSGFETFKLTFRGSPVQKTPKFWPVFGLGRFAAPAKIALALEPPRVNYP